MRMRIELWVVRYHGDIYYLELFTKAIDIYCLLTLFIFLRDLLFFSIFKLLLPLTLTDFLSVLVLVLDFVLLRRFPRCANDDFFLIFDPGPSLRHVDDDTGSLLDWSSRAALTNTCLGLSPFIQRIIIRHKYKNEWAQIYSYLCFIRFTAKECIPNFVEALFKVLYVELQVPILVSVGNVLYLSSKT